MPPLEMREFAALLALKVKEAARTGSADNYGEEWVARQMHRAFGKRIENLEAEVERLTAQVRDEKDHSLRLQRQLKHATAVERQTTPAGDVHYVTTYRELDQMND